MSESKEWYYEKGGDRQGPVSGITVAGMVASGAISKSTLIWREGFAEWTAFENTELGKNAIVAQGIEGGSPRDFPTRVAKLRPDFNFGIFESLGIAWTVMAANFWPFVGFYLLVTIIYSVASNLVLPIFFLTFPIMGGFMFYTLRRLRGQAGDVENLFDGFKRRFGSTCALSFILIIPLIVGIFPLVGAILFFGADQGFVEENMGLVIGGVVGGALLFTLFYSVIAIITGFATLLCLDCDIGWSQAFGLGWQAFRKRWFKLISFSIVAILLSYLGLLVFIVGSFVISAWMVGAFSVIYEKAFGDDNASLPGG